MPGDGDTVFQLFQRPKKTLRKPETDSSEPEVSDGIFSVDSCGPP